LLAFIEPAREDGLERTLREMDYPPTTETLRENVRRQMEREAKRQLDHVIKKAGSARQNAPGVACRKGGDIGTGRIWLCWVNPDLHMTKATGRRTNHVALVMSE
jgi:hypothetical protein